MGVLHNGHKKFIEAEKCLKYLKLENKKIILISNSARPTIQSEANLKDWVLVKNYLITVLLVDK